MVSNVSPDLPVRDDDINNILKEYDPYIVGQTLKVLPRHLPQGSNHTSDYLLEVDEVAQRSRVKLWFALKRQPLRNIKSYIKCIVHTEVIDIVRQGRPLLSLSMQDDSEFSEGSAFPLMGRGSDNPESIYIQQERMSEQIDRLIEIVLKLLPDRQRQAFLCSLKEKVDYVGEFEKKLADNEIYLEEVSWPKEVKERRNLQASGSYARRTIARYMNVDVAL